MKVAVLCEYSGVVRDAFIQRGHDAVSCDLLPTESHGPHITGDCRLHDWSTFDLVIAHPTCTRLCNSGVRWLQERYLWDDMRAGAEFFNWCRRQGRANVTENPIPHRYARDIIGKYDQVIQPWQHGHKQTKATCLWLRGLDPLYPTNIVGPPPRGEAERRGWAKVHNASPGPDRWKIRSTTLVGVAAAMADQWGSPRRNGLVSHTLITPTRDGV